MLSVQAERFPVGAERRDDPGRLGFRHVLQEWGLVVEARLAARPRRGQLLQVPGGRGALSLLQDRPDTGGFGETVHLVGDQIERAHGGEAPQRFAVAPHERPHGRGALIVPAPGLAVGQDETRGQPLDIPFPRRGGEGFVEVVEIEHEMAVGRSVGPEVAHMGIAAKLHV